MLLISSWQKCLLRAKSGFLTFLLSKVVRNLISQYVSRLETDPFDKALGQSWTMSAKSLYISVAVWRPYKSLCFCGDKKGILVFYAYLKVPFYSTKWLNENETHCLRMQLCSVKGLLKWLQELHLHCVPVHFLWNMFNLQVQVSFSLHIWNLRIELNSIPPLHHLQEKLNMPIDAVAL